MTKAQVNKVMKYAKEAEQKRNEEGLSSEATVSWFIKQMQLNIIPCTSWFRIDDEIRKHNESESWFWIIRTVRNNVDKLKWKVKLEKIKVCLVKESDGRWMVWANVNDICWAANIIAFRSKGLLGGDKKFRVDFAGKTIDSYIEHFQSAKSVAIQAVKEAYQNGVSV